MLTYINRNQDGKEKILADEDIDLIDDAVEYLLFKEEFFKASPWNRIRINTVWVKPKEEDVNVFSCKGDNSTLSDEDLKLLFDCWSLEIGQYFEALGNALDDVGTAGIAIAIGGSAIRHNNHSGAKVVTGVFRVEDQAIFTVGSCKSEEDFNTLSLGMCGLAHIVFKILQAKYPIIKETIPPIELGTYVDKTTNDAIAKRVASWFTSGRDSVEKWRASL